MTTGDQSQGGSARDEILAGEYVLGVLSLDARRLVEQRIASDRPFALMVERWQTDLSSFNEDYQESAPGSHVFGRIEQRLFGARETVASLPGLWNSAGFWRWLSLGTSAVAVAALVYASGVVPLSRSTSPLIADLAAPDNAINMLASYDGTSGRMRIVPVPAGRPEEKSLELWLVPGSGSPLSLGVFPPGMGGEMIIPAEMREQIDNGAMLAVTLEPFGGSPTGSATGPIVASGIARTP